jgi:hypothetical protein
MNLQTLFRCLTAILLATTLSLRASAEELRCVHDVTQETVPSKPTQATGSEEAGKPSPTPEAKSYTTTLGLGTHYFFITTDDRKGVFDY